MRIKINSRNSPLKRGAGEDGIISKHAFKSHILTKKTKKRKLALTHAALVSTNDTASVKRQLGLK